MTKTENDSTIPHLLNFEHLNFDIVSDFDIRVFMTTDAFRQHVKLPKSCAELLIRYTSKLIGKLAEIPTQTKKIKIDNNTRA